MFPHFGEFSPCELWGEKLNEIEWFIFLGIFPHGEVWGKKKNFEIFKKY